MIVSEPFAVAYGLNLYSSALIIDIGAAPWTCAGCRGPGRLKTTRSPRSRPGTFVDQVFLRLIQKKYEHANFTLNMVRQFKEENGFVSAQGERVFIELPVDGKPTPMM